MRKASGSWPAATGGSYWQLPEVSGRLPGIRGRLPSLPAELAYPGCRPGGGVKGLLAPDATTETYAYEAVDPATGRAEAVGQGGTVVREVLTGEIRRGGNTNQRNSNECKESQSILGWDLGIG